MAIEFYAGRESETTHEMAARNWLIESLRQAFAESDHLVATVFDFSCGADIDLAIFKQNGVLVVELKECGSPIEGSENGDWRIMDNRIPPSLLKGGRHGNPFHQAKAYRLALIRYLDEHRGEFLSAQKASQADFAHVSAAVAISPKLHPDSRLDFDFGRLRWFRVVSLPQVHELVQQIRSSQISFSDSEIRRLIRDVLRCTPLDTLPDAQPSAVGEVARPITQLPVLTTGRYDVSWRYVPSPPKANVQPPDYLKDLNPQQRAAVEHRGSHLLILAGAGTGKTRTLTYRAAHLLGDCPPSQMLLMTFTNKAANEMYQRIRKVIPTDVSQMWVGTFHGICRRILVEQATKLGYSPKFAIADGSESRAVMERCAPRRSFVSTAEIHRLYSYARNAMERWQDVLTLPDFSSIKVPESVIAGMIASYQRRLKRSDRMDFDDLLANTVTLLEKHPEARQYYQQRFRYILVDEYQDTCRVQAHILSLLAGRNNVTVVGDDSQAIYSFRAASVENMLNFEKQFPGAATLKLEENYRSTPEILALANANIACNRLRRPKNLFAHGREARGEPPWYCLCRDQNLEASFVVSRVIDLHKLGLALKDMVVLFRAGFHGARLQLALDQAGIPYEVVGAKPFFEQDHIKEVLAWLRLAANGNDAVSLGRVLAQRQGLTADLFGTIEEQSDQRDEPFWVTAARYMKDTQVDSAGRGALAALQTEIALLAGQYVQNPSIPDLIQTLLDRHYRSYLQTEYPTDWETRLDDIQALQDLSGHYSSIEALLEQIALDHLEVKGRSQSAMFAPNDRLTLSTVHAAKGLEWKAVFVIGLVEGWFPHYKSLQAQGAEEERRMFHVALTRAQQYLHLTRPTVVDTRTGSRTSQPSQFVTELPANLYRAVQVN